jgi:hypothetical protein
VTVPAWLGPGEGLDVTVTFTPESVRRYADTLYVLNSSLIPRLAVPLEGEGGASTGGGGVAELAGGHTVLWQNIPNPFRARTRIGFSLGRRGSVSLRVFDVMGRTVATLVAGELGAGDHTVVLGGEKLASGVYFYELQVKPVADGGAPAASQHVHRKRLELLK